MLTSAKRIHQHYIPALDGLRGIAILLVITFHYFGFFKIFSLGWIGVDLFFVLSGYLITSRLIATFKEKNYFSKFYRNRALRILPLYYGVLFSFYIIINFFVQPANKEAFAFYNQNAGSFVLFLENWSFIFSQQEYPIHLLHFWTLAVEEQFYLLWPLIIYFFYDKKYFARLLLIMIVIAICFRCFLFSISEGNSLLYFFNTFCRMDSFIIGGALFFFHRSNNNISFKIILPLVSIALVIGIFIYGPESGNFFFGTIGYTLLAIFFAGLIQLATKNKFRLFNNILETKWLIFVGKISYGLYVYHWIVQQFLQNKFTQILEVHFSIPNEAALGLSISLCLLISFLISILSFVYFEMYFLKRKYYAKLRDAEKQKPFLEKDQ